MSTLLSSTKVSPIPLKCVSYSRQHACSYYLAVGFHTFLYVLWQHLGAVSPEAAQGSTFILIFCIYA